MKFVINIIVLFLVGYSSLESVAAEPAKKDEKKVIPYLINADKAIGKEIDNVAKAVDLTLSGMDSSNLPNHSQLILRNQMNWAEGGVFTYSPHLDLKLDLPNLEKKWQLKFSTYDVEQETQGVNKNRVKTAPTQSNIGGGVGFFHKLGNFNTEFQPRIEFRKQLQLSYFFKMNSEAKVNFFTLYPELQFFARSDSGIGQFVSLDSGIHLYKSFILTLINEEQYLDRENIFSTNHGLSLGWDYNSKTSQNCSIIYESSSRPNFHLDRYTVSTAFTHLIFHNILRYTVTPYLAFPRSLDYKGSPGLNLEINLIF